MVTRARIQPVASPHAHALRMRPSLDQPASSTDKAALARRLDTLSRSVTSTIDKDARTAGRQTALSGGLDGSGCAVADLSGAVRRP